MMDITLVHLGWWLSLTPIIHDS